MSKYFRESREIRDNESRLHFKMPSGDSFTYLLCFNSVNMRMREDNKRKSRIFAPGKLTLQEMVFGIYANSPSCLNIQKLCDRV